MKSFTQRETERNMQPIKVVEFAVDDKHNGNMSAKVAGVLRRAGIKIIQKRNNGKLEYHVNPGSVILARTLIQKIR